jgi:hypothetical protein
MARSKFQVSDKSQRIVDGILFDSKNEMKRYNNLVLLVKSRQISNLKLQPSFPVEINCHHYCTYTADFSYFDCKTEELVIEDVKVAITEKDPAYRLRKKAAELYHGIKIIAVDFDGNILGGRRKKAALPKIKKRVNKNEAR